jgi:hypothetical protein
MALQSGTMQAGTRASLTVQWMTAGGEPAKVDGQTSWTSSDPTICEVTAGTGNTQVATLFAPGPEGEVQIQASADADMGNGVEPVISNIDITVTTQAVGGDITLTPMK